MKKYFLAFVFFCLVVGTTGSGWIGTLPINVDNVDLPVALISIGTQTLLWITNMRFYITSDMQLVEVYQHSNPTIRTAASSYSVVYYIDDQTLVHRWCAQTQMPISDIEYAFGYIQTVAIDTNGMKLYISDGTFTIYTYNTMTNVLIVFGTNFPNQRLSTLMSGALLWASDSYNAISINTTDKEIVGSVQIGYGAYAWMVSTEYDSDKTFLVRTQIVSNDPLFAIANPKTFEDYDATFCDFNSLHYGIELDGPSPTALCQKKLVQWPTIAPLVAAFISSKFIYMCTPETWTTNRGSNIRVICPDQTEAYATSTWTQCGCGRGQIVDYIQKSCNVCPAGTYTQNNTCQNCAAGTYSTVPVGTSCTACAPGTISTTYSATTCQQCSQFKYSFANATTCNTCVKGNYSPPLGQGCYPCDAGTYSNIDSQTSCTTCPLGHYTYNNETGRTNCHSCNLGHYVSSPTSCDECPPGTYASSTSNSQCTSCPLGFTTNASGSTSSSECFACSPGTFVSNGTCTPCPPGFFASNSATTACTSCASGTFSSTPGSTTCATCDTSSIAPQPQSTTCTTCPPTAYASDDRTRCQTCPLGTFLQFNQSTPLCGPCRIGYSASLDLTTCTPCDAGRYSTIPNSLSCTLCTAGKYSLAVAPSCVDCEANSFSPDSGKSSCTACVAPLFAISAASTTCTSCGLGSVYGNSTCRPCTKNTFAGILLASTCTQCGAGTFAPTFASACATCANGKTSAIGESCASCLPGTFSQDGSACQTCAPGTYASTGASACTACSDGTMAVNERSCVTCTSNTFSTNGQECRLCGAGKSSLPGSSNCTTCADGSTTLGLGDSCVACENGMFSANGNQCSLCAAGTFSGASASACTTCEDGKTSRSGGECRMCVGGTFSAHGNACAICASGTYSLAGASACTACPPYHVSYARASTCNLCGDGLQSLNGTECVSCTPGFHGVAGKCFVCEAGTKTNASGASTCVACSAGSWCPLGSSAEQVSVGVSQFANIVHSKSASETTNDPLDILTSEQATLGKLIVSAVIGTVCGVIVLATGIYVYMRRHKTTKECCKPLDLFFAQNHYVGDGEALHRRDKSIGGFATVVVSILMVTLIAIVIVNTTYNPDYARATSPLLPPFFPAGNVSASATFFGVSKATCDGAFVQAENLVGYFGVTFVPETQTCVATWSCGTPHASDVSCTLGVERVSLVFGSTYAEAYAAAISWTLAFPSYASTFYATKKNVEATRFRLSGFLAPDADRTLRGGASTVSISHTPVVLQHPSGERLVGSLAQAAAPLVVYQVNQTEFTNIDPTNIPLGIQLQVIPAVQVYAVTGSSVDYIKVVAFCAAYVTGLLGGVKAAMNLFERCFPKGKPSGFRQLALLLAPLFARATCSCCCCRCCGKKAKTLDTAVAPTSSATEMLPPKPHLVSDAVA